MNPVIETIHLFPILNTKLVTMLKNLEPADWHRQTIARKWQIKDVAAHLLDGNFRRIALHRDNYFQEPDWPVDTYQGLLDFLNNLNADWVRAAKRLSPRIITELLETTNDEVYGIFKNLDPFANSRYPVAWAGENQSYNWFDLAREYTERWLHQQQIRDTIGDRSLLTEDLYKPFLEIFMRAMPFTFHDIEAELNTVVQVNISGNGGGTWVLAKKIAGWEFSGQVAPGPDTEVTIDGNAAWKLFSKSIRPYDLNGQVEIKGNRTLGEKTLEMVSVMA
jgi:uncharacterized protein (TIGR03083 family)